MSKKMTMFALAVGALIACALPAAANAQTLEEGGTALAVGAEVTSTSTNFKITTGAGNIVCAKATYHAEVAANTEESGSTLQSAPFGGFVVTGCTVNGVPVTVTAPAIATVTFSGFKGGTTGFTLITDIAGLSCHFSGVPGVTSFPLGVDSFHLEGALVGTHLPCPAGAVVEGDFTLETSDGTPVTLNL